MVRSDYSIGKVNQALIGEIKSDVSEMKTRFDKRFDKLDNQIMELFNHQSKRLPLAITTLITVLSSLCVGLAVYFIT